MGDDDCVRTATATRAVDRGSERPPMQLGQFPVPGIADNSARLARRRRRWAADIDFRIELGNDGGVEAAPPCDAIEGPPPSLSVVSSPPLGVSPSEAAGELLVELAPSNTAASSNIGTESSGCVTEPRTIAVADFDGAHVCAAEDASLLTSPASVTEAPKESQCEFSFAAVARSIASDSHSVASVATSFASPGSSPLSGTSLVGEVTCENTSSPSILEPIAVVASPASSPASPQHDPASPILPASVATGSGAPSLGAVTCMQSMPLSSPSLRAPTLRALRRIGHSGGAPCIDVAPVMTGVASQPCAVAPKHSSGFIARSRLWMKQREHRLERLQEMYRELGRDSGGSIGALSPSSFFRREPSPAARRRVEPSSPIQLPPASSPPVGSAVVGAAAGPASLFARGEAWRERKLIKEKELRQESLRQEASECTFHPGTVVTPRRGESVSPARASTRGPALVTPDRARRLFERQLSWRRRLDDDCERQRREKRQAAEREIRALRRSASAGPTSFRGPRASGGTPSSARGGATVAAAASLSSRGEASDPDNVFAEFYERNRMWQRARDERIEKLHDEEMQQQTSRQWERGSQARTHVRSASASLLRVGEPSSSRRGGGATEFVPVDSPEELSQPPALKPEAANANGLLTPCARPDDVAQAPPEAAHFHAPRGRPVRASAAALSRPASLAGAESGSTTVAAATNDVPCAGVASTGEHVEIMQQMQALRRCLVSTQSRGAAAGWQRALRVDSARLCGAGAAPLRANATLLDAPEPPLPPQPPPTIAVSVQAERRGRTRSPATVRGGIRLRGSSSMPATSREPTLATPAAPGPSVVVLGAPLSESRPPSPSGGRRTSRSPAPPRPRRAGSGPSSVS